MPEGIPSTIHQDTHSLAAGLVHLPGLVCFDNSGPEGAWGGDWVAARPDREESGTLAENPPPTPAPGEFWAGTIDYSGDWRFARYPAWLHRAGAGSEWQDHGGLGTLLRPSAVPRPLVAPQWEPGMSCEDYVAMVDRAREYISAGDIYQVNLAHRFAARWQHAPVPWELYTRLRTVSPAPHTAFLDQDVRQVLSASPETLIDRDGSRILTRPIKGTRPRGEDAAADAAHLEALLSSPKERAELVMITDLERNDLGRISETGSVVVDALCVHRAYAQVHHLVSQVSAVLRSGSGWPEIWAALAPGGSITGAPKKRAMEIIAELEPGPRGLYTGAIGWMFGPDRGCFSIAIRTAIVSGVNVCFHTGAGIVEGSNPVAEFAETHHKARGLLRALGG